jgi:uncharacterized protein YjiS (DUF1127 family)
MTTTYRPEMEDLAIDLSMIRLPELWRLWRHTSTALLARLGNLAWTWFQRTRQRNQLAELDPRMLKDIGLTREQVRVECAKAIWTD